VTRPEVEVLRVRPVPAAAAPAPKAGAAPEGKTAAGPAGAFQVQIGAFKTGREAERQLASVRQRAGSLLAERAALTTEVRLGEKVFYRARYAGFDAKAAAALLCDELKRLSVDCLVMRAE
jgi:D-alanyl-D-alanine carboxypeptidase